MPTWRDDDSAELDEVERRLRAIRDNPEKSTTLRALAQYQLERISALRAAGRRYGGAGSPPVSVERRGPFKFSAVPATSLVAIEVDTHGQAPLVAVVSADEIRTLMPLLEQVRRHAELSDPTSIDVRAALLDLLGHDPFDDQVEGR